MDFNAFAAGGRKSKIWQHFKRCLRFDNIFIDLQRFYNISYFFIDLASLFWFQRFWNFQLIFSFWQGLKGFHRFGTIFIDFNYCVTYCIWNDFDFVSFDNILKILQHLQWFLIIWQHSCRFHRFLKICRISNILKLFNWFQTLPEHLQDFNDLALFYFRDL